jgi:hypothetical protein
LTGTEKSLVVEEVYLQIASHFGGGYLNKSVLSSTCDPLERLKATEKCADAFESTRKSREFFVDASTRFI